MKTAREVLEKYFSWTAYGYGVQVDTKKQIDLALTDLSEIVMAQKKEKRVGGVVYAFTETWNGACDHIAKLFLDKEQTK